MCERFLLTPYSFRQMKLIREVPKVVQILVKACLLGMLILIGWLMRKRGIIILTYHSIDDSGSIISLSPEIFRQQMEFLQKKGYQTVSLETAVKWLKSNQRPKKSVVLTFDDGYRNNYTQAFPVLKKYGFTATIFLVTDYVDSLMRWDKKLGIPDFPLLDWDEIREMSEYGMTFGAHTATHPHLPELSTTEIKREVLKSKITIEERLGKSVRFFGYTYGEWNESVKEVIKELGFEAACTILPGQNRTQKQLLTLKRMGINRFSGHGYFLSMLFFRTVLLGTFPWYLFLKSRFSLKRQRRRRTEHQGVRSHHSEI